MLAARSRTALQACTVLFTLNLHATFLPSSPMLRSATIGERDECE
jgi:hypothetical protein